MKINEMLENMHTQAHRQHDIVFELARAAEAVIPVLLDDGRSHSAARLQSVLDEFHANDEKIKQFADSPGIGEFLREMMSGPRAYAEDPNAAATEPDKAPSARGEAWAKAEKMAKSQQEDRRAMEQEKAHASHHKAD